MTFAKANDLLRLAQLAASRRLGISLEEISQEFGISHRTAQRMTSALEDNFANVVVVEDDDRRRRWRIQSPIPERLQPRQETPSRLGKSPRANHLMRTGTASAGRLKI